MDKMNYMDPKASNAVSLIYWVLKIISSTSLKCTLVDGVKSPAGWLPVHQDQLHVQRLVDLDVTIIEL